MDSNVSQHRILIVDDTPQNIDVLGTILKPFYKRSVALNGPKALKIAMSTNPPDLILLDIMMPGMDGYEVCRRLKENERTVDIPIIFITAKSEVQDETKCFELGAVDYITKPVSPTVVLARVKTHLELKLARDALSRQNEFLEQKARERTKELALTQDVTIICLASLAETRDNETGAHILRTQRYVKSLAEELVTNSRFCEFLDDETIELLYKSAPLHDIGKVGVPDSILLKPGKLTDEEFEIMKQHATLGRDSILRAESMYEGGATTTFLSHAREIAYTHHEKWNGTGYPEGIRGERIPISGRLMAVADVYDALITKRVYKPAFSHEKAARIIVEGKGEHFDPAVVDAFIEQEDVFKRIAVDFADSREGE
ncbi:MAG: two-component system response regulator [Desulfobacterales bacterium]|nr:two-component system response regulator [Desulfobacterales bacterium]